MLYSSKFWIPVALSLGISVLAVLWALMFMAAGGAHGKPTRYGFDLLMFPYAHLFTSFDNVIGIALRLLAFAGQFPLYGIIVGWANFRGKVKGILLGIVIAHLVAYAVASKLGLQPLM
jgi:hypothetical protein